MGKWVEIQISPPLVKNYAPPPKLRILPKHGQQINPLKCCIYPPQAWYQIPPKWVTFSPLRTAQYAPRYVDNYPPTFLQSAPL